VEAGSKKDSDWRILWRVNWNRVDYHLRDELVMVVLSLIEAFDKQTLSAARLLLKVAEVKSHPSIRQSPYISLSDVFQYASNTGANMSVEDVSVRLTLLSRESEGIIERKGESNGGMYVIDYELAVSRLWFEQVESVVREKLDANALRIFRLLRTVGNLEEEQIERHAMIPSSETRKACNALVDSGFISVRQICKTADFAPSRTFYIYSVPARQLYSTMSQLTNLTLRNLIRRRVHEAKANAQLIDRKFKMDSVVASIQEDPNLDARSKQEQVGEVERDYLSAKDKIQLERFNTAQKRLWASEMQVERSLFLLQQRLVMMREGERMSAEDRASSKRRRGIKQTAAGITPFMGMEM